MFEMNEHMASVIEHAATGQQSDIFKSMSTQRMFDIVDYLKVHALMVSIQDRTLPTTDGLLKYWEWREAQSDWGTDE